MKPITLILSLLLAGLASAGLSAAGVGGKVDINADKFRKKQEKEQPADRKTDAAQGEADKKKDEKEKPHIEDFSMKFNIRPYFQVPLQIIEIHHFNSLKQKNTTSIMYQPNTVLCAGVGFSYWIFGFSIQKEVTRLQDKSLYGSTSFLDFQVNYYFRKVGFDVFYQDYKGFWLNEPKKFLYLRGMPQTKRSDLRITTMGGNLFYVFSDRFSFDSAFKQCERQNVSGGSFLLMLSVTNIKIHSLYPLIPDTQEIFYGGNSGFKKGNFTNIGLSPGYAHSFIFGKYFITLAGFLGTGWIENNYITYLGKRKKDGMFIKTNFRFGTGYNADTLYGGLSLLVNATSTQSPVALRGIAINSYAGYIELYAGIRI